MSQIVLYNPYPHQLEVHKSIARRKYVMWPVRSGKNIAQVNDNTKDTIEKMPMWKERPNTMSPKWNVWFVAETFNLIEQLWRDVLAYTPRELLAGEPKFGNMEIPIIYGGRFKFRSAKNEAYLVAEGLDRLNINEAGELPTSAWELLQSRLSSPDRIEHTSLFADGTPRGQIDPNDPTEEHWAWKELQAARSGANKDSAGFYWFEDKARFGNLDHPTLSRNDIGRAEIDRQRHNPNLSERKFREDYLGECLPALIGDAAINGFMPNIHIREDYDYTPRYLLHVWIDFGRNYPAVTFHQFHDDGTWAQVGEMSYVDADLLDTELADRIIDYRDRYFCNVDGSALKKSQISYIGDFEAKNREDSRRENTIEALKAKGINLLVQTKKHGDEELAIDVLNARMKLRQDGSSHFVIHPRCKMSIRCFSGMWIYKTGRIGDYEYRESNIAELHPWIDLFDTYKYGIVHTVVPQAQREMRIERSRKQPRTIVRTDEDGSPVGYQEVEWEQ